MSIDLLPGRRLDKQVREGALDETTRSRLLLPLKYLSDDSGRDCFAAGMTATLIIDLPRLAANSCRLSIPTALTLRDTPPRGPRRGERRRDAPSGHYIAGRASDYGFSLVNSTSYDSRSAAWK